MTRVRKILTMSAAALTAALIAACGSSILHLHPLQLTRLGRSQLDPRLLQPSLD